MACWLGVSPIRFPSSLANESTRAVQYNSHGWMDGSMDATEASDSLSWLNQTKQNKKMKSLSLSPLDVHVLTRVLKSDRTGLTAALRYRFTGPVRPVTGGNRLNSNKFKFSRATGSDRFTGRFDRFDRWALTGRPIFFFFFFDLTLDPRKLY